MTAELEALTHELRATNRMLPQVLARLDESDRRQQRAEERARRHRIGSWVLAVVVAAVLFLGWQAEVDRNAEEARACAQSNTTRAEIRAAIVETVLVILDETDNGDIMTPLVERIQDRLELTIPDREC